MRGLVFRSLVSDEPWRIPPQRLNQPNVGSREIRMNCRKLLFLAMALLVILFTANSVRAQSAAITGTVVDPSGGVVPNATVTIHNPVSGLQRSTTTDAAGNFTFPNVPFNPYHLSVNAKGFTPYAQDVEIRSSVPLSVPITLKVEGGTSTVTVEGGGDLLEND